MHTHTSQNFQENQRGKLFGLKVEEKQVSNLKHSKKNSNQEMKYGPDCPLWVKTGERTNKGFEVELSGLKAMQISKPNSQF